MNKPKSAFLVIFQARINDKDAQTEVPTHLNPLNSREVRRNCEVVARASFVELAKSVGVAYDGKLKCVECIEVREDPASPTEH